MGPNPDTVVAFLQDHIKFIDDGDSLVPNLTVIGTPGHTPGHISLKIDAGNQQLYLIADLLHSEAQFLEDEWSVAFDIDPTVARKSREDMYPKLADPNVLVADGHFSTSSFGQLTNEGGKWVWNNV